MAPRTVWPVLNAVGITITTINEHCTELFEHTRALRRHFIETNQKTIPKQTCFDFFDALEAMAVKLYAGPEIEKIESRLRNEIQNMHSDLAQKLTSGAAPIAGRGQQQKQLKEGNASNELFLTVQRVAPSVAARLVGRSPKEVVHEVNKVIESNNNIPKVPKSYQSSTALPLGAPKSSEGLWEKRVVAVRLLRSGDALLSLRSERDKEPLCQHPE